MFPARCQDMDGARCLLRIDPRGQVVTFRGGPEHFQGFFINPCVGDVQFQVQAFLEGIGPLDDYVQCVHAMDGDMPLRNHQRPGVVEIYSNNDVEL